MHWNMPLPSISLSDLDVFEVDLDGPALLSEFWGLSDWLLEWDTPLLSLSPTSTPSMCILIAISRESLQTDSNCSAICSEAPKII